MDPITKGAVVNVTATLRQGGLAYNLAAATSVTARFTTVDGVGVLIDGLTIVSTTPGSNWAAGVIVVPLTNQQTDSLPVGDVLMRVTVDGLTWLIPVEVVLMGDSESSILFVKGAAVAKMRADRLVLLASSILSGVTLSDDYIWDKIRAAEAEIAHTLRVPLVPTRFFPSSPSAEQVAALPAGMPWAIDPAYDYNPTDWYGDKWGLILTRQKPIQSVISMRFVYPSPAQTIVDVPADWIRYDGKYGQLQLVPTGTQYQTLLGGLFMSQLSGGRTLPFTINLEYIAGLANAHRDYPDLIDVIYKLASTKIVEDAFLPQSGSISADGLSQSMSIDTSKYHEGIDRVLHGSGSNGGLMARIHGIRVMAL